MRKTAKRALVLFLLSLCPAGLTTLTGCEGSEAGKGVEETVRELSGFELMEKGERLQNQIRDLNAQDIERIQEDISQGVYGREE